jgi:hypothetical protein
MWSKKKKTRGDKMMMMKIYEFGNWDNDEHNDDDEEIRE